MEEFDDLLGLDADSYELLLCESCCGHGATKKVKRINFPLLNKGSIALEYFKKCDECNGKGFIEQLK